MHCTHFHAMKTVSNEHLGFGSFFSTLDFGVGWTQGVGGYKCCRLLVPISSGCANWLDEKCSDCVDCASTAESMTEQAFRVGNGVQRKPCALAPGKYCGKHLTAVLVLLLICHRAAEIVGFGYALQLARSSADCSIVWIACFMSSVFWCCQAHAFAITEDSLNASNSCSAML